MDLEGVVLSEIIRERQIPYDLTYIHISTTKQNLQQNLQQNKTKLIEEEMRLWVPQVGGGEIGGR